MSPDLRSRDAWQSALSPKTGEKLTDVIESTCRRYTICRSELGKREWFHAWRRNPKPHAPDLVGAYHTPDAARDACQRHLEKQPAAKEGAT
jgi:hypothetical protein